MKHIFAVVVLFESILFFLPACESDSKFKEKKKTGNIPDAVWRQQENFRLSIIKVGNGEGEVVSQPAGIHCGNACEAHFPAGMAVTLTATPAEGSAFVGWVSNALGNTCTGIGACGVEMKGERTVRAAFANVQVPPVPSGHPRVYVRPEDVPEIQAKLTNPEFSAAWNAVQQSDLPIALAFRYLVLGDEDAGRRAVVAGLEELQASTDARRFDVPMHWGACIYDWCYSLLSEAEKQAYIAEFERIAALHTPGYPADPQGAAVVGHDTEGWVLTGQLPAGVAIYDESPVMYDAAAYLFMTRFVPVRHFFYPAHMHHQGDSYISTRFQHDMGAAWLFRRMGAGDVFPPDQAYIPYQLLYHLRPDGQQLRSGDTYDDRGKSGNKRLIAMLAGTYYEEPHLLWLADSTLFWNHTVFARVLELLFRPAGAPKTPPDSLPTTKYFAMPMGEMVARTGWTLGLDSPDAVARMRIGGAFFGNHQRKDWGTFQIYHRGPLAISSGLYEGVDSSYGSAHWLNYYHQTIAHNGLLIFDPEEVMAKGNTVTANDGGQRWPNGTDHPKDLAMVTSEEYSYGYVTARGMGPDMQTPSYSYIAGDITKAYASSKAQKVTRAMVALNTRDSRIPMTLVVFDRVVSTNPEFRKTWLVHSIQEPEVENPRITIVRDEPTWDNSGVYGGKLVIDNLLPAGVEMVKVGGLGKEFWVESVQTNYETSKDGAAEPGAWRVEVSPAAPAAEDLFLHVLRVMEAETPSPAAARLLEGVNFTGGVADGWGALFSRDGALLERLAFHWDVPETMHLLACDLEEGGWTVYRNGQKMERRTVVAGENALFLEGLSGEYELVLEDEPEEELPDGGVPDDGLPDDGLSDHAGEDTGKPETRGVKGGCNCQTGSYPLGFFSPLWLAAAIGFLLGRRRFLCAKPSWR